MDLSKLSLPDRIRVIGSCLIMASAILTGSNKLQRLAYRLDVD
jgi:hypothetical protein